MSRTFLDYYRDNLAHVRMLGAEFAAEFPKIAARLDLSSFDCADPYVERLLEGTAFLAARVEKRLESGFPRLIESILGSAAPVALDNLPSYCVLELRHGTGPLEVPVGTGFRTVIPTIPTPCTYTTMRDVRFSGATVVSLGYHERDTAQFGFSRYGGLSEMSMVISAPEDPSSPFVDELTLFTALPDAGASRLIGLLTADLVGVFVGGADGVVDLTGSVTVDLPMFDRPDKPCGHGKSVVAGLDRLVRFLAYPSMFKFFTIRGLSAYFAVCKGRPLPMHFVFSRREDSFVQELGAEHCRPACVPAVNLFRMRSDRCRTSGRYEYHVVPDRTAPLDYEVSRVLSVDVFDDGNRKLFRCAGIYDDEADADGDAAWFVMHRRDRLVPPVRRARSSYVGSEVFLSFSGRKWNGSLDRICQFQTDLLCTNRELPLLLRSDAEFASTTADRLSAGFASPPSRPGPPLIRQGDRGDWDKVAFVALNLSGILWQDGETRPKALGELILAYSCRTRDESEHLAKGIKSVASSPRRFRFVEKGGVFYESGWDVVVTLSEQAYEGVGMLFFALVLRDVFRAFLPLNAFMRLGIVSDVRGEVVSWQL